jgi:DNA-binding transcriptional ArsR family regulator
MSGKATPKPAPPLVDPRLLKALAHPTRVHILDILSEGPSSPVRMMRRMENISLNLVSHHVKVLRDLGCIELIGTVSRRGSREHMYRARERRFFSAEEWEAIEPKSRQPITSVLLRMISEDAGRSLAEGKFDELPDNHLSRAPVELDAEGWSEVVASLARTLDEVLEAHARSAERAYGSGEELMVARVVMMQFLIGREDRRERGRSLPCARAPSSG